MFQFCLSSGKHLCCSALYSLWVRSSYQCPSINTESCSITEMLALPESKFLHKIRNNSVVDNKEETK